MKKFNFIYGAVAAVALIFASCSNEQPKFDDADAFVAFTKLIYEPGKTLF
jgi:PBP1b-binding outer membrane lipoprotein LpoB